MSEFDKWIDRGHLFLKFGLLPIYLGKNSNNDTKRMIWFLIEIPWFLITLPIELLLCIPACFCGMMAASYLEED